MNPPVFSWKTMGYVCLMTMVVGIGQYAIAHQFNDGKITQKVMGYIFLGMSIPSILIGGVLRMFSPHLQRYFAFMILICLFLGLLTLFTSP